MFPTAQKREDVVVAREKWKNNESKTIDTKNTYWLDESSINCGMTRVYGRALSNERICDYVPDIRFERTSIIGLLGIDGISAPFTFKGTLNSALFGEYVKTELTKVLKKGDTLILDNASVHKVKNVMMAIVDIGVNVVFLPAYSPDFNPIELAWSKMKSFLRKTKARTFSDLLIGIKSAIANITAKDASAWITHCGYTLQKV